MTLVKSPISHTARTRGTIRALGLHRLGETVEVPDAPHTRGMVRAVRFLVETEEVPAEQAAAPPAEPSATAPAEESPSTPGGEAVTAPAARRRSRKKEESES